MSLVATQEKGELGSNKNLAVKRNLRELEHKKGGRRMKTQSIYKGSAIPSLRPLIKAFLES